MKTPTEVIASDRIADRLRMFLGVVVIGGLFGFGSTAQYMLIFEYSPMTIGNVTLNAPTEAILRISLNLIIAICLGVAAAWLRVHDRRLAVAMPLTLLISVAAAVLRTLLQMTAGVSQWSLDSPAIRGAFIVVPIAFVTIVIGMSIVALARQARTADRALLEASVRAALALEELQNEELRVRREVADTLHGTLQGRFVLIEAELSEIAARLEHTPTTAELSEHSSRLRELSGDLDEMRERDLRGLSSALYPEALDRGLVPAARALVARIPASIPVAFSADGVPTPDLLERPGRLLLVRTIEEGISNALRHGRATSIELKLSAPQGGYEVEVRNRGFAPDEDPQLSGLARLRTRLAELGGGLELNPEPGGGVLTARLPVPQPD